MSVGSTAVAEQVKSDERADIILARKFFPTIGAWKLATALHTGQAGTLSDPSGPAQTVDQVQWLDRTFRHIPFYTTYSRIRRYDAAQKGKNNGDQNRGQ